jgi:hypothetical protein
MGASSDFEWYVDESSSSRVKGWIVDLKTLMPAEVSFLSEGKPLFRTMAGGSRLDVQKAGKVVQYCGIDVALDPKIWERVEALDVVLADGSVFASLTKPTDVDDSASNILEAYKSTFPRPLRIKAYLSHRGDGPGEVRRALYFAPIDDTWVEKLLLPEAALPCFVVMNDEFVTLISRGSNSRADHEGRRVVRSLDELTHTQLTAEAASKEENYAAFSGDFFELPKGITVCHKVRVMVKR